MTVAAHEEATLSMPPYDLWLQGHDSIARWLLGFGIDCKGSRLVPVQACGGTPAFAQYRDGGATPSTCGPAEEPFGGTADFRRVGESKGANSP